jgi:hypothetical protein
MRLIAMRYLAVFATVVVTAARAASAPPEQEKNTKQEENTERVRYGDEGHPNSRNAIGGKAKSDAPGHEGGWVQLATPTPAKHGTEFVFVGKEQGAFDKLRVDADKGTVIVRRVRIYFDDGKQQVIDVDRALNAKHKAAVVELKSAQAIDRIVITTEPQGNGTYALYGSSVEGVATR